jgi:hypothetical protein
MKGSAMTAQKVFAEGDLKTHMPFFDGRTLLFCRGDETLQQEYVCRGSIWRTMRRNPQLREHFAGIEQQRTTLMRVWKLAYAAWRDRRPRRLETGLPAEAVECSPAFYRKGGTWQVSFIGGVPTDQGRAYRLYAMSGPSLGKLSPARRVSEVPTRVGFVSPQYVCLRHRGRLVLSERDGGGRFSLRLPLSRVYRASFCADHVDRLLITGLSKAGGICTLLHRLDTDETFEVKAPGPVYKSSLFDNRVVFTKSRADDFEDRELWHGPFELVPSEEKIRRVQV